LKNCVHIYENGKMRPTGAMPGMGGKDKGE
jgi:hypothetical protein